MVVYEAFKACWGGQFLNDWQLISLADPVWWKICWDICFSDIIR